MSRPAAFLVVIPARFASSRLQGKPLADIGGKPMVVRVAERARESGARAVWVATDNQGVYDAVKLHGHQAMMTRTDHATGTDRIAEVAAQRGWSPDDLVVNLQGDEPLMPPALVRQVAALLARHATADIATLAGPLAGLEAFLDPNVVKVVTAQSGRALYFSRAPIPWNRDAAPQGLASQRAWDGARRHIGLYAYRVAALRRLAGLAPTRLERLEKLEQLRALEHGMDIRVEDASQLPGPDVNTAADLERVAALLVASPGAAP